MDCTGLSWAELDFTVLYWDSLPGRYWIAVGFTWLSWAVKNGSGLYWAVQGDYLIQMDYLVNRAA